jgi:cytochrome d ubiquinol oxidase subunit I
MTEIGRQPWIVFGVLRTSDAVSPTVGGEAVLISLITFTLLYGALAIADVYLLIRYAKGDLGKGQKAAGGAEEPSLIGSY